MKKISMSGLAVVALFHLNINAADPEKKAEVAEQIQISIDNTKWDAPWDYVIKGAFRMGGGARQFSGTVAAGKKGLVTVPYVETGDSAYEYQILFNKNNTTVVEKTVWNSHRQGSKRSVNVITSKTLAVEIR